MSKPKSQVTILWVIWSAQFVTLLQFQFFIGGFSLSGVGPGNPSTTVVVVGIVSFALSALFRWILVPKAKTYQRLLIPYMIGLFLSMSVEFYGLFLIGYEHPKTQLAFFILSAVGSLQFIPIRLIQDSIEDSIKPLKKKWMFLLYPAAFALLIFSTIPSLINFIHVSNTHKFMKQLANSWKYTEQKYPEESVEKYEHYIEALKSIDTRYTPEGIEENFNDYIRNFELSLEATKKGQTPNEYDQKSEQAMERIRKIVKENYDY